MERAVITGPTGCIGNALIERLLAENVEVVAVCRPNTNRKSNLAKYYEDEKYNNKFHVVEVGLDELKKLPAVIDELEFANGSKKNVDVFYHFGWGGTFGNIRNDMDVQLKNVAYTLDAVSVAKELGVTKFVGAGSQAEYGRVEGMLDAMTPAFPENGYGIAKLTAGQMSRCKCQQLGIEHVWSRILSVYGPYDRDDSMVSSTIDKLFDEVKPSLTKGEQKWDYLYSKDAGYALYLIGKKGVDGKVYCLGSGSVCRLRDYVKDIRATVDAVAKEAKKTGKLNAAYTTPELGFGEMEYPVNQVMFLQANIEELKNDTGFVPQYDFEKGIRETVEWRLKKRGI